MSDYFFYDLNKKMADLASQQQLNENAAAAKPVASKLTEAAADYSAKKAAAGKDIGKPGKNFDKIAAGAAKRYGSAEAGKRVAGAVLNKLRNPTKEGMGFLGEKDLEKGSKPDFLDLDKDGNRKESMKSAARSAKKDVEESAFQAAIGKKKYGEQGMKALQKAGRDHASAKTMSNIRNRYDKYDESRGMADEGNEFSGNRDKAIKAGQNKFNVDGRTYPVKETNTTTYAPGELDGATAPPAKGKDGRYPVVTSGPNKGKRWSPTTPGPTNPTMKEGDMPMPAKQKSMAKLAPVVNKITFADKIVGAKKEVDEMLGDVAAMAMKNAVSKMRSRNRDMEEGFMDDEPYSRKSSSGGRIDTSEPGVTRHRAVKGNYSGAGYDVAADDDAPSGSVGRRKVGAGMGKKIGAKINTGKSKLMTREGNMSDDMIDPEDRGEYDREGEMAKDDIKTVVRHAQALEKILGNDDNLPEWVQSKLAKIVSMMTAVDDYMQSQRSGDDMAMAEERTGKRDNRAEQAGRKVTKDIEYDEKKKDGIRGNRRDSEDSKAEKAGKKVTKDIEYDEKKNKKKKEVDETTTSGSVATGGAAPKSTGSSYGKGIYDSLNRQLENMISESMNINMSMNNDQHGGPRQSLTVTATDDDAVMLAGLLKMAGMGQSDDSGMYASHDMDHMHSDEPCDDCGQTDCECDEMMDEAYGDTDATENAPDYPTDQEGTDNAMMYSGGLNGPKSTGQTTVPVIDGQDDRMGYNGDDELRRMMEIAGISK